MRDRRFFAAVLIVVMVTTVSAQGGASNHSDCSGLKSTESQVIDFGDENILGEITGGDISDSRMAGIGVILILIATTLYAGLS